MAQDMKVWRKRARIKLRIRLGGVCVDCGVPHTEEKPLIFSHKIPLTEDQAEYRCKVGANQRLVMYRREAAEGRLTLRCQSCNIKQAQALGQGYLSLPPCPTENEPF